MSPQFPNAVSPDQDELLQLLGQNHDLILIGGTALALQIDHRESYDLDG